MAKNGTAYRKFSNAGKNIFLSVYALRSNSFKIATIVLGLLGFVLVAWIIGQTVHYQNVKRDDQNKLKALTEERDQLKTNLYTSQRAARDLEINRKQAQERNSYLSKSIDQLRNSNMELTNEKDNLRAKQSQAEASNSALNKELKQLKDDTAQLQKDKDALSTAQTNLKAQYDAVVKVKNELQANYDTVNQDRNNLQNKFNNVSRSRDQLQKSYNDMIKKVEELHDRHNFSLSEKDKLASDQKNLTAEIKRLQGLYSIVKKAEDDLQASYGSVLREKNELENRIKNLTKERDLLKAKADNLTDERQQLLGTIDKLNATIQEKNCTAGWKKFQYSCYFPSTVKKTWALSRLDCVNKGADLAIINSREEMNFINSLYSSDKEVWIGLTDKGVEGQWKWVDETPLTLAFWGKGQPNSHQGRNQDCVEFWHHATGNGDWNDENCSVEQQWICEK